MSNYDINHGSNIIFLPARRQFMWVHQLPGHWSDHKDYTAKLKNIYKKQVSERLAKIIKKQKPCEVSRVDAIEKLLYKVEDSQFDVLVSKGLQRLI